MATAIFLGFSWLAMLHGLQGGLRNVKLTGATFIVIPVVFDLTCIASLIKWSFFQ